MRESSGVKERKDTKIFKNTRVEILLLKIKNYIYARARFSTIPFGRSATKSLYLYSQLL
jgi:hypothetical protein